MPQQTFHFSSYCSVFSSQGSIDYFVFSSSHFRSPNPFQVFSCTNLDKVGALSIFIHLIREARAWHTFCNNVPHNTGMPSLHERDCLTFPYGFQPKQIMDQIKLECVSLIAEYYIIWKTSCGTNATTHIPTLFDPQLHVCFGDIHELNGSNPYLNIMPKPMGYNKK